MIFEIRIFGIDSETLRLNPTLHGRTPCNFCSNIASVPPLINFGPLIAETVRLYRHDDVVQPHFNRSFNFRVQRGRLDRYNLLIINYELEKNIFSHSIVAVVANLALNNSCFSPLLINFDGLRSHQSKDSCKPAG